MEKDKSPTVIGLCGRSGSGKGFVSALFAKFGVAVIDTDLVYRELTSRRSGENASPCLSELVSAFGEGILASDGSLNRKKLASIVFADDGKEKLKLLNKITHKHILAETDRRISAYFDEDINTVIVDAPVLFESGYDKKCDFILATVAPEDVLVSRIMSRDGISKEAAVRRLSSQMPSGEYADGANFVINTDKDEKLIQREVQIILSEINRRKAEDSEN